MASGLLPLNGIILANYLLDRILTILTSLTMAVMVGKL